MTTSRHQKLRRGGPHIPGLKADINQLARHLHQKYLGVLGLDPARVIRQVTKQLRRLLLPHKRRGAKPRPEITRAYELWRMHLMEKHRGRINKVNWLPIYKATITGFASLSEEDRKKAERRLQTAVYNRAFSKTPQGRRRRRRKGQKVSGFSR